MANADPPARRSPAGPDRLRRLMHGPSAGPILLVAGAVVLANLLYLVGLFDPNPMAQYSNLAAHTRAGVLGGQNNIDPNLGFTSQALGHLAARDWLHGHIPWWNPFEGLGMPLAGEMQSAALFPLVVLDAFANGQLLFRMALELTAGLSMLFLLRRLVSSRWAATAGAVVFALNGTFAWMFHAPGNPVAFAPMLILGIEQCRSPGRRGLSGWPLTAIAIALSLYAGFPEMAFIDGLLALLWAAIRASEMNRGDLAGFARRLAAGAAVGALLAAPILVAFVTFTQSADLLDHGGNGFLNAWMSAPVTLPALVMPYVYGPIFSYLSYDKTGVNVVGFWGNIGGYLGASLLVLGLAGLMGRRERRLRVALALWLVLAIGRTVGMPGARQVVNAIPGVKQTAFFRYSPPSWTLALVVLAVLAVDDLARRPERRRLLAAGLAAIAITGYLAVRSSYLHDIVSAAPGNRAWLYGSLAVAAAVIAGCVAAGLLRHGPARAAALSAILAVEALGLFVVPELSAPRSAVIDTAPVRFLQQHLGQQRFFTLGPIAPNYGSYFGTASINLNDEPIVGSWSKYIVSHLNDNAQPAVFTGTVGANPAGPTPAEELVSHLPAYEAVRVRYVVAEPGSTPPSVEGRALPVVFSDRVAEIFELPHPAPFQSARGGGCRVVESSLDRAVADCAGPGTLTRLEQYMPGWTATVNGRPVRVSEVQSVFQAVPLGAGRNVVRFSFSPPHAGLAEAAAAVAVVILVLAASKRRWPRRKRAGQPYQPAHRRRPAAPVGTP